jgi:hypothetical protein
MSLPIQSYQDDRTCLDTNSGIMPTVWLRNGSPSCIGDVPHSAQCSVRVGWEHAGSAC